MTTRYCPKCRQQKEHFWKNRSRPNGYNAYCADCCKEDFRRWINHGGRSGAVVNPPRIPVGFCKVCYDLPHRRQRPTCPGCGLPYAEEKEQDFK
jgi:endogenous inhibitor of DNA gyrase (YacG/DUF329 family)